MEEESNNTPDPTASGKKVRVSYLEGNGSSDSVPQETEADHELPPDVANLNVVLDEYEFIRTLGQGGMGTVYEAVQKSINRPVAIKILQKVEDDEALRFAERFEREVHVMAQMSHANIVTVYSFGETTDGQLFFVMEFVKGCDLAQIIQQGNLDTGRIFKWIEQICDALFYAHSMGVIHRDIKPGNILITEKGDVKIADFGLAKLTGDGITDAHTRLTMTNMAMGTPDYVAPEVLETGASQDHRVDIYAIGVMLYEMLTGKVPRGAWKPPSGLVNGIHRGFDEIVVKAMDPDQNLRYKDASEFSTSLLKVRDEPVMAEFASQPQAPKMVTGTAAMRKMVSPSIAQSAKPVTPKSSSKKKKTAVKKTPSSKTNPIGYVVGGLVIAMGLLLLVVIRNSRKEEPPVVVSGGGKAIPVHPVVTNEDRISRKPSENNVSTDLQAANQLTGHTGHVNGLILMQGSPLLAVSVSGGVKTGDHTMRWWDVKAGTERNRVDNVVASTLDLSPDGKYLLTSNWKGAELYDSTTGKLILRFPFGELGVRASKFSLDSKHIAIGGYNGRVALFKIDSKEPVWILEPGYDNAVTDLAFIPETQQIIVSYGAGKKNSPLPPRVFEIGGKDPVIEIESLAGSIPSMTCSADGRYLLTAILGEFPKLVNLETGELIRTYKGFDPLAGTSTFVKSLGFFDQDRYVYASTTEGQLGIWETESGKLIQRLSGKAMLTGNTAVSLRDEVMIYGGGSLKKDTGDHDLHVLPLPSVLKASEASMPTSTPGRVHALKITDKKTYGIDQIPTELGDQVVALSGTYGNVLALRVDGSAIGWGEHNNGGIRIMPKARNLMMIDSGLGACHGVTKSGVAVTWGPGKKPAKTVDSVKTVAAGQFHWLLLKKDGTVSNYGAMNNGYNRPPKGLSDVTAIAAGVAVNLALKSDGTVVAWGENEFGECDVPDGLTDVVRIACGPYQSFAVTREGKVVTWGRGNEKARDQGKIGRIDFPPGLSNVSRVVPGPIGRAAVQMRDGSWQFIGQDYDTEKAALDTKGASEVMFSFSHIVYIKPAS